MTVAVLVAAALVAGSTRSVSIARYSPSSCLPVAGLIFGNSVHGGEDCAAPVPVTPAMPKSLSLLITISRPPCNAATPSILSCEKNRDFASSDSSSASRSISSDELTGTILFAASVPGKCCLTAPRAH